MNQRDYLTEIFKDMEEEQTSDFLDFFLHKKSEFFRTHQIQIIKSDVYNPPCIVIFKGEKLNKGLLTWCECDINYSGEEVLRTYELWLFERRDQDINRIID